MINENVVIKLYERCNSDGRFSGYMCDTKTSTCIADMYADKEIWAFKMIGTPNIGAVCIALKMGEK
jgi:hypothetical protein